jgi:kynurenine formamidase
MSRIVDLSHPIEHGSGAYRGFPEPVVEPFLTREDSAPRYDGQTTFEITRVSIVGSTGTYIDSPYHRFDGEDDLSMMPLEILCDLPGVVVEWAGPGREIDVELDADAIRGHAVLFRTGWSDHWGTDAYWDPGPFLGGSTLDVLCAGASLVGVDFANVDDTTSASRPAHTRLLSNGVPIVEHMTNLAPLQKTPFRFFAPALAIRKAASFPVRAFALIG